jgi:outer membrane protein assembly factor BamB
MRIRFALSVPVLTLLACTGAGSHGIASATPHPQPQPQLKRVTPANWITYHGDRLRTGYAPTMPPASGVPTVLRHYALDGNVYASPIIVGGRIIVATENDTVYAIENGRIVWHTHLGTPAPDNQTPCGNIAPLGITGTPVFHTGVIYVAAEFASPARHRLIALGFGHGHELWRKNIDLPGVETDAMQERGALTFAGGRVWVPFGGLAGDCGGYKGRVVGVKLDGTRAPIAYTVPTAREAGIWTPPGPVWGGKYLFVQVGNGASVSGDPYDKSDSVLALTTGARLHQFFAPVTWASDNAADLDLGSQGPALVGRWVFADGKRGTAYVLHRTHLGGIGGAVAARSLCVSFGGTAVVGSRVFVPCTDGIRAVRIDSTGHMHVQWHASSSVWGSPVVGGGRVWSLDPDTGTLYALNPATGNVVNSVSVGVTSRFATPAIYGSRIFVPTLAGLTVVATS